jgi:hypothetical protein
MYWYIILMLAALITVPLRETNLPVNQSHNKNNLAKIMNLP